jgi:hypothetical protein
MYQPGGFSVGQELLNIAESIRAPKESLLLSVLYAPPQKPRDGTIVMADGTQWNPGSGGGVYCYRAGAWRFLG